MDTINVDRLYTKDHVFEKCIMCRKEIPKNELTREHIFPKWLLHKYHLWELPMELPNGASFQYNSFWVPCCQKCNGERMSPLENQIKKAVEEGFDSFIKLDRKIIAWWLYKIYYSKLVKETQMRQNLKEPHSAKIISDEALWTYNHLYTYMTCLLSGDNIQPDFPYELYIYKTSNENVFDYLDVIETNTLYMRMNDILIVCSLDSGKYFLPYYEREIKILNTLSLVHPLQTVELFVRISFFRYHYDVISMPSTKETHESRIIIQNTILKAKMPIHTFGLYCMLKQYLFARGLQQEFPPYRPDQHVPSLIHPENPETN